MRLILLADHVLSIRPRTPAPAGPLCLRLTLVADHVLSIGPLE